MAHAAVFTEPDVLDVVHRRSKGMLPRRWAATWIDLMVVAAFFVLPDAAFGNEFYQSTFLLWFLLALSYFPLSEGLTGRSLGKLVVGTVVVTAAARPPGLWKATLRTLTRVVEVNPVFFGGLPALFVVLLSTHRQRLGDMLAGTYVVRSKDLRQLQR